MSGKRAISLFMAFNSQIIYKYIQVQMWSTALVLYLPMEIAIWQKLYDHMCRAFQDQGDEATFPLNISSYVRMSRWFPGEIQWASSLTFSAHSCYFHLTIFRFSRFHVAFDYNKQTIFFLMFINFSFIYGYGMIFHIFCQKMKIYWSRPWIRSFNSIAIKIPILTLYQSSSVRNFVIWVLSKKIITNVYMF